MCLYRRRPSASNRVSSASTLHTRDIRLFALVSGGVNLVYLDIGYAAGTPFGKPIAQGM